MFCLVIGLILFVGVVYTFVLSEAVTKARINEMAHQFADNHILENLQLKEGLMNGEFALDDIEVSERIQALDMAMDWQRKHSRVDAPETPQNRRGI